jgi:2,3-bisphosphoglycerate-independent phosphoglycerate mutase
MMNFFKGRDSEKKEQGKSSYLNNILDVRKFVVLIILDGFGIHPDSEGNAVLAANTPFLDVAWTHGRSTLLNAAGVHVGMPERESGNSEVGHLNLGAGQVVYQSLPRINDAIKRDEFYSSPVIQEMLLTVEKRKTNLHLTGVLSPAGVHGNTRHLYSLLELCQSQGVDPFIHVMLDGRDTSPMEGIHYIEELEKKLSDLGVGKIASIQGRFFGMDRDSRWERTKLAYDAMVGLSEETFTNPVDIVEKAYQNLEDDQYFKPRVRVDSSGQPVGQIKTGDAVLFWNFREDRARQLTKAFIEKDFKHFNRRNYPKDIYFATMTGYEEGLSANVIFPPLPVRKSLSSYLSENNKTQFHIAETEKYMHVTYFFNGGIEQPHEGEVFFNIPSPRVEDYVDIPEMRAFDIKNETVKRIRGMSEVPYDFILLNFANPDMIGHTGDFKATIKANQVVDKCVAEITKEALQAGGAVIITADHGNCETMINRETKKVDIAHTNNPVPFTILTRPEEIESKASIRALKIGTGEKAQVTGLLADVAPTALGLVGLEVPVNMTGIDLRPVI